MRRRAVQGAGVCILALLVLGGIAICFADMLEENQVLDRRLRQFAYVLQALVEHDEDFTSHRVTEPSAPPNEEASGDPAFEFQIWSREGALLLRSKAAPTDSAFSPLGRVGFSDYQSESRTRRAFALPAKSGQMVIQVAEEPTQVWRRAHLLAGYYVGLLVIPFALVFGSACLLLQRSFRSIDMLADQLAQRNPQDLSPLRLRSPPREMLPIVESIEFLFSQVGQSQSAERSFTSLAAHEMRTPLAGIRAQAQWASSTEQPEDLQEALNAIRVGVDRASYLLDQLLDLARVDALPANGDLPRERLRLSELYEQALFELQPLVAAKRLRLTSFFVADEIEGHGFALGAMLRNLLSNAIRYCPPDGSVETRFEPVDNALVLTVDDSGPGIAGPDRARAFERFNRLARPQGPGAGLGLSIALTAVAAHHAKIQLLDSPLGGLRVQVLFFRPASVIESTEPAER